jgi:hypothetical protein
MAFSNVSSAALSALSTLLGSAGVFCLVASFRTPILGAQAFVMLAAASAITLTR